MKKETTMREWTNEKGEIMQAMATPEETNKTLENQTEDEWLERLNAEW